MQNYRKLDVWVKAHALAIAIHHLTARMPKRDNSGFIGQIRRAALSIPANIAEGCGRLGNRDFAKFLQIAIGSAVELEYHLQFAADTGLVDPVESAARLADVVRVRKMLYGLVRKVRSADSNERSSPKPIH